jgi:two-component system NarL family sensor kinase
VSRRATRAVRVGARRELTLAVTFGLAVMLVVGLLAVFASESLAEAQALEDSEQMTRRLAAQVVAPLLPGYLSQAPDRQAELDRAVADRMSDGYLIDVVVWAADGEILYSDRAEDVGRHPGVPPPPVAAAIAGRITSDFEATPPITDGTAASSAAGGNGPARYVEVYSPLVVSGLGPMAFEACYDDHQVNRVVGRLLQTLPLVLVPLLLLQLIQIPVAVSWVRRWKRRADERSRLLERVLDASDQERVRFAAELHDGPIQDLAGVSYGLAAVAPVVPAQQTGVVTRMQEDLQWTLRSLRGLMSDLRPPDLASGTLDEALDALGDQLRAEGLEVTLDVAPVGTVADETVSAIYRVARETAANVVEHAQAARVRISVHRVEPDRPGRRALVRLEVADDGLGVDPSRLDRRSEGHLRLRLLADRVDSLGGRLTVVSEAGRGTTVRAEIPAVPPGSLPPSIR